MWILSLIVLELLMGPTTTTAIAFEQSQCDPYTCNNSSYSLTCRDFNSWSELNTVFITNHKNCTKAPGFIGLQPSSPIVLTSELNISIGFFKIVNGNNIVWVSGLKGVNVYPWPALDLNEFGLKQFVLFFSAVNFYVNNTPPSVYTCNSNLVPDNCHTA
jgi:hypothetical protein